MIECPFCGMEMHASVHDTDPDVGEYEIVSCSYCGYVDEDSKEWLPGEEYEGYEDDEDDETDLYVCADCGEYLDRCTCEDGADAPLSEVQE